MVSVPDGRNNLSKAFQNLGHNGNLLQLGNRFLVNFGRPLNDEDPVLYPCIEASSGEQLTCQVVTHEKARSLQTVLRLPPHAAVHQPLDVYRCDEGFLTIYRKTGADLHSHIRSKKQLGEQECRRFFRQIVEAVQHCHKNKVIVGELKLKKFVFLDEDKTRLGLLSLQHCHDYLARDSDMVKERNGCPAYVCPEMLEEGEYSGRGADMWSLGVILFTMLSGRYPFYATSPSTLFAMIKSGNYQTPDDLSFLAKSLIASLLQVDPTMRLSTTAVLEHPWFNSDSEHDHCSLRTVPKALEDSTDDF